MNKDLVLKDCDTVYYKNMFGDNCFCKVSFIHKGKTIKEYERIKNIKVMKVERTTTDVVYEIKEILDEKEKEWLGNFIKSTKIKNCKIKKWLGCSGKNEYLQIKYDVFNYDSKRFEKSSLFLPIFKKGTMYKGTKIDKEYTLEELGL